MELITGICIAICWILLLPIFRWTTTFFHEMGHAIPALFFTNDKVEVFVGSYGDRDESRHLQIGRLSMYFNIEVMDWQIGMCIVYGRKSWLQDIIITLGGPIASTLICGSTLFYLISNSYSDTFLAIGLAMFLLALLDLVVNLFPRETSYSQYDKEGVLSDGAQLRRLFYQCRLPKKYFDLQDLYNNGDISGAIDGLQPMVTAGKVEREYFYLLIDCLESQQNHLEVIKTYEKFVDYYPLSRNDYKRIGLAYYELKDYTECIRCLNEYLYTDYGDFEGNCARGMARMHLGDEEEALRDFEAAIAYSKKKDVSIPLAHRGYIRLKLGDVNGAIIDLNKAKELNVGATNAHLIYYYAVYHEHIGSYAEALSYYISAKEIDYDFHGLAYKIYEMEERIQGRNL